MCHWDTMALMSNLTQWAGQFGLASELSRRHYVVTFTLGNTTGQDILCCSPEGRKFSIEVKTIKGKTSWLFSERPRGWFEHKPDTDSSGLADYYALIYIPTKIDLPMEYYLLKAEMLRDAYHAQLNFAQAREASGKKPYAAFQPGIDLKVMVEFTKACECRNQWNLLPPEAAWFAAIPSWNAS